MTRLDELRAEVATGRGLPPEAGRLLTGTTLSELEASADRLVEAVSAHRHEPERDHQDPDAGAPATLGEVLAAGAVEKQRRQRALLDVLHGVGSDRPRDARGRFASGGFDGGARTSLPPAPPTHDQWLAEVIGRRLADRGANL